MTPAAGGRSCDGVTLVLGGARSGKSAHAERLVEASGRSPVYIATGQAFDDEMRVRIADHRSRRGAAWRTVEAPLDLVGALEAELGPGAEAPTGPSASMGPAVLVDCLTLWLTNLMLKDRPIADETSRLVEWLARFAGEGPLVLVSNEVGLGIVPENAMARAFRDHAGRLHQAIAKVAGTVLFMAAGLPLRMKG